MLRRDFLQSGTAAVSRFGLRPRAGFKGILLMLTGGPSHLDTWDMKPDAPTEYRSPFRPIRTSVPGIHIASFFPRMARLASKYALVRSVWHDAPSLHEASQQMMQSGGLAEPGLEPPLWGDAPGSVTLPRPRSGLLRGETLALRERYGLNAFGQNCLEARRLVETGTRFVTVNMYESVYHRVTWDCHGWAPFSTLADYQDHVGPRFDAAFSTLLEDLSDRGLLATTLVVAMGEFGRAPKINPAGGRDHWPLCSTVVMAGGGVQGGQVYGSSDRLGAEPRDNPVHASALVATLHSALGMGPPRFPITGAQPLGIFL